MPAGTREVPEDVPPPPRRHHRFAASRGRSRGRDNSRATAVSLEAEGRIEAHPPTRTAMSVPPSQSRPDARPHLPVLDGIRGCAILLVMATHLAVGVVPANRFDAIVLGALQGGWIGVDLFFVLSGFLITGILLDSRGGPRYYAAFFARRALRILPLYWLFLAILACDAWFLRGPREWAALMLTLPWHLAYLTNALVAIGGWRAAAFQT